ncbi:MAG: sigma-70 family RNA polymerase sigma factor [Chitinophagaceae bacterium]
MLNFRGDAAAFRNFIDEHKQRVFNLILKRVQHLQDAEEITQDVFVDVYRNSASFRGDAAISTWLYRIAMNKCIDHLRKKTGRNKWSITSFFNDKEKEAEAGDFIIPALSLRTKKKRRYFLKR